MAPRAKFLQLGTLKPRPFKPPVGTKPVWLPNFTITLLRTPSLPPQFASFLVPLNMNKLDLKDYLYHAYSVPVLAVRSYIQQQPVQNVVFGPGRAVFRRWYRPKSIKKMTVEMGAKEEGRGGTGGGIFVWPEEIKEEDMAPWDKKVYDQARKSAEESTTVMDKQVGVRQARPGWDVVREQARRLREGKEEWKPTWQELRPKDE